MSRFVLGGFAGLQLGVLRVLGGRQDLLQAGVVLGPLGFAGLVGGFFVGDGLGVELLHALGAAQLELLHLLGLGGRQVELFGEVPGRVGGALLGRFIGLMGVLGAGLSRG